MVWTNSSGRDLSHHNTISDYDAARAATNWVQIKITESTTYVDPMAAQHYRGFAGVARGAYHFARPGGLPEQIRNFLARKNAIGPWERPDMLDCEFDGVTGTFIRDLVAEYRTQFGQQLVLVYCGVALLKTSCDPALWYDTNTPIWAARYRKIGAPAGPDDWARHLGWDHPGLAIYQWDNDAPLPGGATTDINAQRIALGPGSQEGDMDQNEPQLDPTTGKPALDKYGNQYTIAATLFYTNKAAWQAIDAVTALAAKVDALAGALTGQVDVQALAAALGPLLARIPDDQIADLVTRIPAATRQLLATALAGGASNA